MNPIEASINSYSYPVASMSSPFDEGTQASNPIRHLALRDIDLKIPAGSVTILVGASGCGKSTLLRALGGLIPKFFEGELDGEICINGVDLSGLKLEDVGHHLAFIFQNPRAQFFTSRVDTEMAFSLENYATPPEKIWQRVLAAAAKLDITSLLTRELHTLSGGQAQRVAAAYALVAGVDIVLADEPTSNLSPEGIGDFASLVAALKAQGKTLVIAEHRLHLFRGIADTICRMEDGRIVETISGKDFFARIPDEIRAAGLRALTPPPLDLPFAHPDEPAGSDDLVLEHVRFSYARKDPSPLIDIDRLIVPAGAVTAIVGDNGVGKTTLARVICGLEKPQAGTISLGNHELSAIQRQRRCALVMQDVRRQLFSESVAHELELGIQRIDPDHLHHVVEQLQLGHLLDRHPLSCSGGEAQRVAVGAALASRRHVLILDEPTSGVDRHHLDGLSHLIRQAADSDRVVIVITHDPELIARCCDQQYVLHHPIRTCEG